MINIREDGINRVESMITTLRMSDGLIDSLLSVFQENGYLILIGGAIRSALEDDYKLRDIDMIVKLTNKCDIDGILKSNNINYKKNRFGGYKIFFSKIIFDLWTIENHWGFKSTIYDEKIENIEETTLLNYDSLVYDYYNKKLYKDYYDKCIKEKEIDIIGTEDYVRTNPCPDINTLRILKIKMETGYNLSSRTYNYIQEYYKTLNDLDKICRELKRAYIKHYGCRMDKKLDSYIYKFLYNVEK